MQVPLTLQDKKLRVQSQRFGACWLLATTIRFLKVHVSMSDIKLFRLASDKITELTGTTDTVEKSVQILFETNLEALLGVRFLATEFTTTHGGRIDTLGLDENGCPVILNTSGPRMRT